jgi:hypothetical protein
MGKIKFTLAEEIQTENGGTPAPISPFNEASHSPSPVPSKKPFLTVTRKNKAKFVQTHVEVSPKR